jgi:4'-phosphopantetheinyl transferase
MKQVLCWIYDVSELSDPLRFSRGMAALPWEERREKVMRFRFEKDRRLCLGAGLLAAEALRRAGATDLRLRFSEYGKPSLPAHPGIHFNLSHSGTLAVCAVSDEPVGVDTERLTAFSPEVASLCFQPREQAWLEAREDHDLAFTRLWTRKESWLKYLGTGLSLPAASFSALPGETPGEEITLTEYAAGNHRICVCARTGREVSFRFWQSGL